MAAGQVFLLAHGALACAGVIADGLTVDAARMRRNLDSTGRLIVAVAVVVGLAPLVRRDEAHHPCDAALARDPQIAASYRWNKSRS